MYSKEQMRHLVFRAENVVRGGWLIKRMLLVMTSISFPSGTLSDIFKFGGGGGGSVAVKQPG